MTDHPTENARLRAALTCLLEPFEGDPCRYDHHGKCQAHFLEEECCVAKARAALATPAPDAVQEAARFLAEAIDKDMQTFNHSLTVVDLSPDMPVRHFFSRALVAYADTLRAIAGDRT